MSDDAATLQEKIDRGEPILGGQYRLTRPVRLQSNTILQGAYFEAATAPMFVRARGSQGIEITNCRFKCTATPEAYSDLEPWIVELDEAT